MRRRLIGLCLTACLIFPLSAIGSTTFSTIVALGDSLTDNGSITFNTNPNPADLHGFQYYTDGAVWVEMLAGAMGGTLNDVAYGGATTGYDNPAADGSSITGLQWQVENAVPAAGGQDTLFTVWAGANDFFQGRDFSQAAENIGTALDKLKTKGAESILVPNLPDLGLTPGFYGDANPYVTTAQASGWSMAFNQQLSGVLQTFADTNPSVDVYLLDVQTLFSDLILMDNGKINPVYWDQLFWDEVHPSLSGHTILAGEACNVLQGDPIGAAVPIPSAVWLLGSGLMAVIGLRGRFQPRRGH